MTRWLPLLFVLSVPAPALAQETPDSAFARIDTAVGSLKAADTPEARAEARERLLAACDAFLTDHLDDGAPHQLELAGGYWLDLAMRMDLDPERILARVKLLRERLQPMPPRLSRACRVVEASLRVRPGQPAPDWTATSIHGDETVALSALRGKTVLLDFWATWCAPCLQLMSTRLRRLHRRYGEEEGFVLVGVGSRRMGETAQKQAEHSEREGFGWLKVFDAEGSINQDYGVRSLPFLVLIDEEGQLVVLGPGHDVIDEVERRLAERFGPLVPEPEPDDED
jgi:thiol-disulfide isomerase/thioredoxin